MRPHGIWVCRAAYFLKGIKLLELEDLKYFANSNSDSSSNSDSGSGTDTDDDGPISESSSSDDSGDSDDEPTEVVWAKAARGVWGMAHVFDGKLYLTRGQMQGNFIPKNLKLAEPKPAPKPQPRASSSGEHVQLFRMVYDRYEGFPSRTFVGFASFIACANMGVNLKFSCSQGCLVFACIWKCGWRLGCIHTMRMRTCVLVVVCVARE